MIRPRELLPVSLLLPAAALLGHSPRGALATVQLPKWFGDGMVLQASSPSDGSGSGGGGPPAFLAGRTVPPGEEVSISGDVGVYTVTSDTSTGRWRVTLGPSSGWNNAQTGMRVSVRGATGAAVVAERVLAGDVFFCSGQSNMLFTLHQAINYTAEATTLSRFPNFRFFMANRALNATPQFDLSTNDKTCDAAAPPPPPPPPESSPSRAANVAANTIAPLCVASSFLQNTAFGHGDGPSIGHAVADNAADCCAQCSNATWAARGCQYFTWHPSVAVAAGGGGGVGGGSASTGMCFFKTEQRGPTLARTGYVSGGTGAPPPPPKPCNRWLTAAQASANSNSFLLSFSAVCFLTVRDIAALHTHFRDRPMGLVQVAWGGSRIESWMSRRALQQAGPPVTGNVPPVLDTVKQAANVESALYNGMVSPFVDMSWRAMLWYQGEANADQSCQANSTMWPASPAAHARPAEYYSVCYDAMLRDWRDSKGYNFALGTVQLPPSVKSGIDPAVSNPEWAGRPDIRWAQATSRAHPQGNTTEQSGVAVTIDCGGASNWGDDHPPNKSEMSRRLALQLLHMAYKLEQDSIPLWTGPAISSVGYSSAAHAISLAFTPQSSAGGLSLRDVKAPTSVDDGRGGVPKSSNNCTRCCSSFAPFEVTFDKNPASARLEARNLTWVRLPLKQVGLGKDVSGQRAANLVTLKLLDAHVAPTAVRYAWSDFVDCVLDNGNSSGIPASPFRYYL